MKKILMLISLLSLGLFNIQSQAGTATTTTKASATLASVCTISSQNVSFGQVALPISAQSATSNMIVECSKGSSYTISLAYGGIYGLGNSSSGDYWQSATAAQTGLHCLSGTPFAEYNSSGTMINVQCAFTQPANPSNPAYAYGKMIGSVSGDNIAYSIQVPNTPSKVWNAGENSYTSTGTGASQTIPVVATLVPAQTTNQYPTVDTYLDVVTATVSY
jgi:spore coat protein U-like protein